MLGSSVCHWHECFSQRQLSICHIWKIDWKPQCQSNNCKAKNKVYPGHGAGHYMQNMPEPFKLLKMTLTMQLSVVKNYPWSWRLFVLHKQISLDWVGLSFQSKWPLRVDWVDCALQLHMKDVIMWCSSMEDAETRAGWCGSSSCYPLTHGHFSKSPHRSRTSDF